MEKEENIIPRVNVSGRWLSNGKADSPRAIFQAGRVLILATISSTQTSKNPTDYLGVGLFTDETHISVPIWEWKRSSVTAERIEWTHGENWTRPLS
jgi:hypothetical protein